MKDTTVAARYARALFMVTERRKETAAALAEALTIYAFVTMFLLSGKIGG